MKRVSVILGCLCCVLCCVSCSTKKWGAYDIVYETCFQKDYFVRLLKTDTSMRFYVTYRGKGICEADVAPEETRVVVSPYLSKNERDNISILCDGNKIRSVNNMTLGTNTITLFDRDGDGYPETRCTYQSGGDVLLEYLEPEMKGADSIKETTIKETKGKQGNSSRERTD